ncbi:MAG: tyrosinase family protein [Pseudonocardiaceae bacterium]
MRALQAQYDSGNKKPLEDLVRAWLGIKKLPPTDPRSFFVLAGYHGEPFHYRKQVDALSPVDYYPYWGGYCNHGNILFPTWHRVYVLKLEEALQSIVSGVMMPYWDETTAESLQHGIPSILTQEKFELDGQIIDNPLRSFVLPEALSDFLNNDDMIYEKPAGYETVRYPLSGLVGTEAARKVTETHNAQFPDPTTNTKLLNNNIVAWLKGGNPTPTDPNPSGTGVFALFQNCLHAPNYTVFSNTTSAGEWNNTKPGIAVTSLETPHNDIHLAIGGFDIPAELTSGQIADANGDMGEPNTAGMDPIFFFHHCNVDRIFWLWQKQNGQTDHLDLIDNFKGTSSSDDQGPTPGIPPDSNLDLNTPLNPFKKTDGTVYTSHDCINIEKQLGFTYAPGSLDDEGGLKNAPVLNVQSGFSAKKLMASGIDRALFQGSFALRAYATVTDVDGKANEHYLGHYSVFNRRNSIRCANCQTHMEVVAHFPLDRLPVNEVDNATFRVEIQHRGKAIPAPSRERTSGAAALPAGLNIRLNVID